MSARAIRLTAGFFVSDLNASIAFYERNAFAVGRTNFQDGWSELRLDDIALFLLEQFPINGVEFLGPNFQVECLGLAEVRKRMPDAGEFSHTVGISGDVAPSFVLRDPDQNILVFSEAGTLSS